VTQNILITGGVGFIGCNTAARFIRLGERVTLVDNLSRIGAIKNLHWLNETFGSSAFEFLQADVLDPDVMVAIAKNKDVIIHLAGQVAVTTSVTNPRSDFENNALGTFNVLEAARLSGNQPIVLFSSTNKVYGKMEDAVVEERESRYEYRDYTKGIPETYPLDFHSPYGCSKGAADQYVRDYARIYGLRTVVLRQSCIYGPRQMGVEDQGWVAWFCIAVRMGKSFTIYGDGKQVRDILYVDDLIDAYQEAIRQIETTSGKIYNIGGGAANTISVWAELGPYLEKLSGRRIPVIFSAWRPGDQRIYISDITKAYNDFGWKPKVGVSEGIDRLWHWVTDNPNLFQ
jgi:CDP-paratose 2-epimerase